MLHHWILGLFCAIIFASQIGLFDAQNQCRPRTPLNVTMQDIDGTWFAIAYVNDTNPDERDERCIREIYNYNPERDAIEESRTSTSTITEQTRTIYFEFAFEAPGFVNLTYDFNNTAINLCDHFLEFTRDNSYIFSNCVTANGTLQLNRLVLFMTKQHVGLRTIRRKFASIGIPLNDVNVLFRIPQKNCSYGM